MDNKEQVQTNNINTKTCFNCGTQSANYYQKWRQVGIVCHKCYMRLFRAEKKNELANRDLSDQSMSESGCESYYPQVDDQNNNSNNSNGHNNDSVMQNQNNTFPVGSSDNNNSNNNSNNPEMNPNETMLNQQQQQRKDSTSTTKSMKQQQSINKTNKNQNMLPPGLMPPSHIDTSIFKKPVTQQEAQANMIKSLNAAHYYAGYYEAMKQLKK